MAERGGYGEFCPVSMASEIVCTRWTTLILRELLMGSTRFNDIRRAMPRLSPTLLSTRLKELEAAGILSVETGSGATHYILTEMGQELLPIVTALGSWGHRWIESRISLRNLNPSLLMWDMRRRLDPQPLPPRRCTIQFLYPELAEGDRRWWLVVDESGVDLCKTDPGYEVDLLVTGSLRSMTAIWMGITTLRAERSAGRVEVDGDPAIARSMDAWLGLSAFAAEPRRVA